MASIKSLAKAAKLASYAQSTVVNSFNEVEYTRMLTALSTVLIKHDADIGYDVTDSMSSAVLTAIKSTGLGKIDLDNLIKYRAKFENALTEKHGVKLISGPCAFTQDVHAHYKNKNVPQMLQVVSGVQDILIGHIYTSK